MEGYWQEFNRDLERTWRDLRFAWARAAVTLRNRLRGLRRTPLDYVVMPISGTLPERAGPPRNFLQRRLLPPEPLSLQRLNARLQAVADADNVRGVVFVLQQLSPPGLATLQNLRRSLERLRAAGKEVVVFTAQLGLAHYYVASIADRIIIPPSAQFELLGLRVEAIFLKEALAFVGIDADIVQISPYKTAGNIFDKAEITPEQREQLEWLLEDNYDVITSDIAAGRGLEQRAVQALVDRAPFFAEEALSAGLVDAIAYEDELPYLLAAETSAGKTEDAEKEQGEPATQAVMPVEPAAPPAETDRGANTDEDEENGRPRAKLLPWDRAYPLLTEKVRLSHERFIGVVSLEGLIVTGESQQPPLELPIPFIGGLTAGHETINRLLRRAERNKQMAALIFHVDSNGGAALASDLIWRQIQRIARKTPVLVYMGNVAASGGYYVSAGAGHIMAQTGTLTGSIGVLTGRFNTDGLYERLNVNRTVLRRGEHANLYSDAGPLTDEERKLLWQGIVHTYDQFLDVVAAGRELPRDVLEEAAGGRVWTGRQAQTRKLVDSHGDFVDAVARVAEMARLPADARRQIPVANFYSSSDGYRLPRPFASAQALADQFMSRRVDLLDEKMLFLCATHLRWH